MGGGTCQKGNNEWEKAQKRWEGMRSKSSGGKILGVWVSFPMHGAKEIKVSIVYRQKYSVKKFFFLSWKKCRPFFSPELIQPHLTLLPFLKNNFLSTCSSRVSSPRSLLRSPVDKAGLAQTGARPHVRLVCICSDCRIASSQISPSVIWVTPRWG